ncbi:MAG: transporter substrate-binding domain-containing protein, partial [Geminicoccaceae bacterium]
MFLSRLKQWSLAAIGMLAVVTAQPALARTLDEVLSSGKLVVGINPTLPPLGLFNDKNEIDGFDADVSRKIA